MRKIFLALALLMGLVGSVSAQTTQGFDRVYAFHPDTNYMFNYNVVDYLLPQQDQILLLGRTLKDTTNYNSFYDWTVFISALNYGGDHLWTRQLSFAPPIFQHTVNFHRSRLLAKISNNRYVTAGVGVRHTALYDYFNPFLFLFNENGDSLRKIDLPTIDSIYDLVPFTLTVDKYKKMLCSGVYAPRSASSDTSLMFLDKYDSMGNLLWHRSYAGLGGPLRGMKAEKIITANDGSSDYMLFGKTGITDPMAATGSSMFFAARMDSAGNLLWMKAMPRIQDSFLLGVDEYFSDLIPASDEGGGYYFLMPVAASDTLPIGAPLLGRMDEDGNILWARQYNYPNYRAATPFDLNRMNNGDLLLSTNLFDPTVTKDIPYQLCLDAQGNVKWAKDFTKYNCPNGIVEQTFHTAMAPGNRIVQGGAVADMGFNPPSACFPHRNVMGRVILSDSLGRRNDTDSIYDPFTVNVINVPLKTQTMSLPEARLLVFPNPAGAQLTVGLANVQAKRGDQILISDMMGRQKHAAELREGKAVIAVGDWTAGTYVIQLFREGRKLASSRFVKK